MKLFNKTKPGEGETVHPLIAIRDLVIFPHSAAPVYIQKTAAVKSIEQAMAGRKNILLAYFTGDDSRLDMDNLNEYATIARIVQVMKLPNNSSRVLLEGIEKVRVKGITEVDGSFMAVSEPVSLDASLNQEISTRMRALVESFRLFARDNKKVPKEILQAVERSDHPHMLMDMILAQTGLSYSRKLSYLNLTDTIKRLDELLLDLESEKEVLDLKKDISKRVKQRMDENHREFVINEQIKELNRELGKEEEDPQGIKELEERLSARSMGEEIRAKAEAEIRRLKRLQPISPEAGILRGYLEWIADLPWNEHSDDRIDLTEAATILDEDHYDMKEPKDRILDFLAVLQMKQNLKGPILCFVGPPGTGKTSLGKSLARAMGRNFVRISLGGVRDEAEIRGHRRTYVGALPGKIIQGLKKAGTSNPVFLLDEIDKLSSDHRGDPSSALLEVLDPEQNRTFTDHYMEVPVDLSRVLFVTTANSLHGIPYPLLDRMEIIQIPGYTRIEKARIAEGFIIPKQIREHGLDWADIRFSREAINEIIDSYTRESGVRNLEREIAKAVRKIARQAVEEGKLPPREPEPIAEATAAEAGAPEGAEAAAVAAPDSLNHEAAPEAAEQLSYAFTVGVRNLKKLLGSPKHDLDLLYDEMPPGLVYGMAWTELGGKLLPVEAIILNREGKGDMTLTGSLGDVMKESARIALSLVRKLLEEGSTMKPVCDPMKADLHIHVPEGAIPKDGPSAGITLTSALLSVFTGRQVRPSMAMTGEITLTGRVLPVGGIKEKVLAAHRNGFTRILLPGRNRKDHDELPPEVKKSVEFIFLDDISSAIPAIFPES